MNKLKPCQFCGGEALHCETEKPNLHYIFCYRFGARIRAKEKEIEAIKAWNRRTE